MSTKEYFKGLGQAKTFERGSPFRQEGSYLLKIKKCILKQTRDKGPAFIAEFEVLETSTPNEDPKGVTRSWFQKLQDKDVGFGAVKEFMYGVIGVNTQDAAAVAKADLTIEDDIADACDNNEMEGQLVKLETTKVTTKKNQPFTRHKWIHVPQ